MYVNHEKTIVYVVLGIYPCSTGGMEIFYHKHIAEMAQERNVALITSCTKFKQRNVNVIQIPSRFFNIKGTGRIAKLVYAALVIIRMRKKINYVHVPYTSNAGMWGVIFPLLRKLFGIKYVIYNHGGGMRKWGRFNFDSILFKQANKLFAVSDILKYEFERRSKREIEIVYPLTSFKAAPTTKNSIRKKFHVEADEKVFLFVGSLKPLKNPDLLLEAFLGLGITFVKEKKLKLVFVGAGSMLQSLKKKTEKNAFEEYVLFEGKVPNAEIPQYYKMADFYIIPSKFEGTPIALIEAMFNKRPIIGSAVDGIKNIITQEQNGLLFKPEEPEDLRQQMLLLINQPEVAYTLGEKARDSYEEQFEKNRATAHFLKIYND